jgi:hypothetical protein
MRMFEDTEGFANAICRKAKSAICRRRAMNNPSLWIRRALARPELLDWIVFPAPLDQKLPKPISAPINVLV